MKLKQNRISARERNVASWFGVWVWVAVCAYLYLDYFGVWPFSRRATFWGAYALIVVFYVWGLRLWWNWLIAPLTAREEASKEGQHRNPELLHHFPVALEGRDVGKPPAGRPFVVVENGQLIAGGRRV